MSKHKILVLGANGMLGNAVLRYFATRTSCDVVGAVRSTRSVQLLPPEVRGNIAVAGDMDDVDALIRLFGRYRPSVVINCVGLVKQLEDAKDPVAAIPINSVLPHRLARICLLTNARLIHLSTDCVFSGKKGMYVEEDLADARDVYGRTKLLGEVDYPHTLTLRTSIIGHELASSHSLVCWFLRQQDSVRGFSRAVFSGLPTVEIARIIAEVILPRPEMSGLYHLSAEPIDKASLLRLIADVYGKAIDVYDDPSLVIDRSLDSTRFRNLTGFQPENWTTLITRMAEFR